MRKTIRLVSVALVGLALAFSTASLAELTPEEELFCDSVGTAAEAYANARDDGKPQLEIIHHLFEKYQGDEAAVQQRHALLGILVVVYARPDLSPKQLKSFLEKSCRQDMNLQGT